MKNKLNKYFLDLEKEDLPHAKGMLSRHQGKIACQEEIHDSTCAKRIFKYTVNGIPFIFKFDEVSHMGNFIHEIASSQMFRKLGMSTPPQYPFRHRTSSNHSKLGLLSQDINQIGKISVTNGNDINELKYLQMEPYNFFVNLSPWHIITDQRVKEQCLEFMTEECYDEMTRYYLLEELRSSNDYHRAQFFLYKLKGSDKYNGIIPIDLEHSMAIGMTDGDKDLFDYFINKHYYDTPLPFKNRFDSGNGHISAYIHKQTYANRIKTIKQLIQCGLLSDDQIKFLKSAVNYDLPKDMQEICDKYPIQIKDNGQKYVDITSRLWEYNHSQLDRELQ